jgi:hypothetical protein
MSFFPRHRVSGKISGSREPAPSASDIEIRARELDRFFRGRGWDIEADNPQQRWEKLLKMARISLEMPPIAPRPG